MIVLRLLGVALAPVGAVLMLLGGWWPVRMGEGSAWALKTFGYLSGTDTLHMMAFALTPAGTAVLAASLALVTWPRR